MFILLFGSSAEGLGGMISTSSVDGFSSGIKGLSGK
jgi:hypothetical protein